MTAEDPAKPDPSVSEEDLVAYLDGEADERTSRQVEELLASDPRVRKTLHRLEKTWDLLDALDGAEVDNAFTRSTLEMVALAASQEVARHQAETIRQRRRQWLVGLSAVLAAGLAGFFAVVLLRPDPDRQLLEDLPVLENLTQYSQVRDFEFLEMLYDEGLFGEEPVDEPGSPIAAPDAATLPPDATLAQRRRWIEQIGPAERSQLLQAQQRFAALSPAEQERLRALSGRVESSPDAAELYEVLQGYYKWLTGLPLYRRAELADMPAQERIEQIRKMIQEEEDQALRRPSPDDTQPLLAWIRQYALRHDRQITEALPESLREDLAKASPDQHRRLLTSLLWTRTGPPPGKAVLPDPTDDELAEVRALLSPRTRRRLENKSPDNQWRLISSWCRYAIHYQGDIQRFGAPFLEASEAELLHFFEFELTPEQRDNLLGLPGDEMQRQLRRMYFRIKWPRTPVSPSGETPSTKPPSKRKAEKKPSVRRGSPDPAETPDRRSP